jgi:hypothetical protein
VRAVYVLVAILSFVTPQVSTWGAIERSMSGSGAIFLSAPASGITQISRPIAKIDKTFGGCWAITEDAALLHPSGAAPELLTARIDEAPNVDLQGPPLAPRPPPLAL